MAVINPHHQRLIRSFAVFMFFFVPNPLTAQAADLIVSGIGYPPIRAVNESQALLMARRAAVLDAYSKIVWKTGPVEEGHFFSHMSGFIEGVKIISEALLPDGGVQVLISIEKTGSTQPLPISGDDRKPLTLQGSNAAPKRISREEWFQVIASMVVFETETRSEKQPK